MLMNSKALPTNRSDVNTLIAKSLVHPVSSVEAEISRLLAGFFIKLIREVFTKSFIFIESSTRTTRVIFIN